LTTNAVNVEGTLNVLLAARDEGVRRVVFASSSSVYGSSGELPRRETAPPDPISPYAVGKLAAERYCVGFSRVYGLETVVLRYFNVFGPRQDPTSQYAGVVPRFITRIREGRSVEIDGDGYQTRDFTYVKNVVDANLRAASAPNANGEIINIATGGRRTVNEIADRIAAVLKLPLDKTYLPPRTGDVRDSWAAVERARELLDWQPRIGLDDGLRITADYFLKSSSS
jgi:UDP-glucose 4-epimerase